MQVMKWSALALAVTAATTQLAFASAQSESKGLVEDTSFDIFNRVLYMNRDFRNGASNTNDVTGKKAGYREETGYGLRLLLESGFTQGTVGVGFDAHSLSSFKLDGGRGHYGSGLFGQTDEGRGDDTQTEVGGAVKFRVSDTVLKYGNQFVASPVFSTDDSRILPEVATGTYVVSNEIEGLELSGGHFTANNSQENTTRDGLGLKSADIVGISYQFTDDFSAAFHASDVEDYWKKYYGNLNYTLGDLNFDFNIYKTDYEKGYIESATANEDDGIPGVRESKDNTIWSLGAAYTLGAHTFTLGYQQSNGDRGYDYGVDGGGTVWLTNSVQYSDFNGEDERSYQARYDLDMTEYGVPGLSFMTRYITGTDITVRGDLDAVVDDNAKEHELDIEAKYVVQEGAAKDLSFRVRNAIYRTNSSYGNDINDFRLIVEYPLDVL
ncbi:OprD family outer membrane porin [Pseudomonas sp. BMS12]|uniref:OprD family outer membrane porin n=1 Tax=Pseudomonas sp. BMS12 TaxID=1796033 RepID=UPI00083B6766|nr:OprD family outer membrane porin [Pseudomonas sp. BMS12]